MYADFLSYGKTEGLQRAIHGIRVKEKKIWIRKKSAKKFWATHL